MKALRIDSFGLDRIALAEVDRPVPAEGQALLRVRAASLNFRDVLVARGDYNRQYPLPLTLGSDAACVVESFGPGTDPGRFRVGDRVCPALAQSWFDGPPLRDAVRYTLGGPLPGVFAEYVTSRVDALVPIPSSLSDVEAACLPCAGVTAYSALAVWSRLEAGQSLLSLGSGGVSSLAIQLAKQLGARVIATTTKPDKAARLEALGAEVVTIDGPGWGRQVRARVGGEGVDHVMEVGGAGTLAESLQAVRPGGTVSLVGVLAAGEAAAPSLTPVIMRNIRLQGVFVGHHRAFEALVAHIDEHPFHPVVDRVFPLEQARDAIQHLISGQHVGKVCLTVS
jgi:NADPH:quinone reductase-like Zn-dependent oxidoreductase